jgi:hypothetical protein
MAQDLTVNIKTTSDVPQAMDKAKAATVGFGKQVDDIGKKFSMAFKDIAFAFVAPLVLLNSTISFISGAIAKAAQDAKDAMAFAERGESKYLRPGTVASARELSGRRQDVLDRAQAKLAAETVAREQGGEGAGFFSISENERARFQYMKESTGMFDFVRRAGKTFLMNAKLSDYAKDPEIQDILERRAIERTPYQPDPVAAKAKASAAAKDLADLKAFAGKNKPGEITGYGNVIGVGSNIAIEMAQMQIDELKRHTELLQMIATKESVAAVDFSKGDKSTAAPSRAKLLSGK